MTYENLIVTYGYPAIFLGAVLEGETVLLISAVLVHKGLLDFQGVLLAASMGAFTGDQFFYRLGRRQSPGGGQQQTRWQLKIERATALLDRHPRAAILGYRFCYGLRAVIPYLLGAGTCRPGLFTLLSGISAVVWSVVFTTGGYCGGRLFSEAIQIVLASQKWLLLAVGIAIVPVLIGRGLRLRKKQPSLRHRR